MYAEGTEWMMMMMMMTMKSNTVDEYVRYSIWYFPFLHPEEEKDHITQ